jgi:hypothetical protein
VPTRLVTAHDHGNIVLIADPAARHHPLQAALPRVLPRASRRHRATGQRESITAGLQDIADALSRIAQLDQGTALPDQCLHSAEADVRLPRRKSGFGPEADLDPIEIPHRGKP